MPLSNYLFRIVRWVYSPLNNFIKIYYLLIRQVIDFLNNVYPRFISYFKILIIN